MARQVERSFEVEAPVQVVYSQSRQVLQDLGYMVVTDDGNAGYLEANNSSLLYAGYRMEIRVEAISASKTNITVSCGFATKGPVALDPTGERKKRVDQVERYLRTLLDVADSVSPRPLKDQKPNERQKLFDLISGSFEEEEIRDLIFLLGFASNDFKGDSGNELAVELIKQAEYDGRLEELKGLLQRQRPNRYHEFFVD